MRKNTVWAILLFAMSLIHLQAQNLGYSIEVFIDKYQGDSLILAARIGSQLYPIDTSLRTQKSKFLFWGKEPLEPGIYAIIQRPERRYFEFLIVDEQEQRKLKLQTKNGSNEELLQHLQVEKSLDNKILIGYFCFVFEARKQIAEYQQELLDLRGKEDLRSLRRIAQLAEKIQNTESIVYNYAEQRIDYKHRNRFATRIIRLFAKPNIPEGVEGQEDIYTYLKWEFLDAVAWNDSRLLRTPFLDARLLYYIEELTPCNYQFACYSLQDLLYSIESQASEPMYQHILSWLLRYYEQSELAWAEEFYAYLAEVYFCEEAPNWLGLDDLQRICQKMLNWQDKQQSRKRPAFRQRD